MQKRVLGPLITLSTLLGMATTAWGHAVQTDYFVDLLSAELELQLTATYSSGEPMAAATVLVYAPGDQENPWLQSKTDTSGNFTFVPDESLPGQWHIEFTQAGHQDRLIVPMNENGIDYNNITQVESTDVHYAQSTPAAIVTLSLVSLGIFAVATRQRLSKQ